MTVFAAIETASILWINPPQGTELFVDTSVLR